MAGRLTGKVALITGASSGIGQETALAFAREGASIGINYARSEQGAQTTLEGVRAVGARGLVLQADVADEASVQPMVEAVISEFGHLDILVNNAGTTYFVDLANLEDMTSDKWDRIFDVNVKGIFWCSRAASSYLKQRKGHIINITSIAGLTGRGSSIAYAASKAAAITLTKSLAIALAPEIRVNSIAPGMVDSPWNTGREERVTSATAKTPLGRVATPQDIASIALDMAAGYGMVTGQTLLVDGGGNL